MDKFYVYGPCRLAGKVAASGAKNAALPALAATLLTDQSLTLRRIPKVQDIRTMQKLLEHLGKSCERVNGYAVIQADGPLQSGGEAPYELVKTMRASVLTLGPLVARRGLARVSLPGGCAIGVRPIDQHLEGLAALGADVSLSNGYVVAEAKRLYGARFRFSCPTVTGTENVMMAATLAKGTTVLENCAREPEVVDLATMLRGMGAKIDGDGTDTITIEGVPALDSVDHSILPDRIEGGTYLIGAALTGGDVTLEQARPADLAPLLENLAAAGALVEVTDTSVRVRGRGSLSALELETAPHPGFPTDLQAQLMALLTQAEGESTIRETIFENRFQHAAELGRMGANIQIEGGTAKISGATPLAGASVMATDLRASACLVLAGLAADGETRVDRIYHLDRGYENMESKLQDLGAHVERHR